MLVVENYKKNYNTFKRINSITFNVWATNV